jgi:mannose-6-phosphate isomerase-like protein (cupin superfamily)
MKNIFSSFLVLSWIFFCDAPFASATADTIVKEDRLADAARSKDFGKKPWIVDIEDITLNNADFRVTKWTGTHLQMTLMTIAPGGEIGGEIHPHNDQFIRVESGRGRVIMGSSADNITFDHEVADDWAIFIPAGYWHNLLNPGNVELKIYALYGPPEHPEGTLHRTFEESENSHHDH